MVMTKGRKLEASNSLDDDNDELDENESKEDEDEIALLSKKLHRILGEKRNNEKRRQLP